MMIDIQRIVVKIGTSTLTGGSRHLDLPRMMTLVQQITRLMAAGKQVVIVSSGAIAVGRDWMDHPDLPRTIPSKQMLSAVGQPRLMNAYEQLFSIYNQKVAQVLLTREDISDRRRYLNARSTLESLMGYGVVAIVNENDTVATEEISIGDNDNLSALVANLVEADLLVLLTDQPGLFTADPKRKKHAELITLIDTPEISREIWEAAGGTDSALGTGGMVTKLQAAEVARRSGTDVVIADGGETDVLVRLAAGEAIGTRIRAEVNKVESRKRFMLAGAATRAAIYADEGAVAALKRGGSLLPVGISAVQGKFSRGDIVRVKGADEKPVAVGMVSYSSRDIQTIMRHRSREIKTLLGYAYGEEVIHHNNMTVL